MEQLGLEPSLLLAQIVNFAIVAFVLTKLLYKPILEMLEKRKKEIAKGLALTEKMEREEEKRKEKHAKLLEKARLEAKRVVDEGKERASQVEKEMLAAARAESQEIVARGKTEVEQLHAQLAKDVRKEAVTLAVAMSKRLLSSIMKETEQRKLIKAHLDEIKKIS